MFREFPTGFAEKAAFVIAIKPYLTIHTSSHQTLSIIAEMDAVTLVVTVVILTNQATVGDVEQA